MINVQLGSKQEEKPFPKLMKDKNLIVFFTKEGCGVVLANGIGTHTGEYVQGWNTNLFTDYNEPVTLQNA